MENKNLQRAVDELLNNNECLLRGVDGGECTGCPVEDIHICHADAVHYIQQKIIGAKKETAKDILSILYELCVERKEITWDDIYFLTKIYGVEVE